MEKDIRTKTEALAKWMGLPSGGVFYISPDKSRFVFRYYLKDEWGRLRTYDFSPFTDANDALMMTEKMLKGNDKIDLSMHIDRVDEEWWCANIKMPGKFYHAHHESFAYALAEACYNAIQEIAS